ncbi:MAG: imelysin family protein [Aeromicrobium sp.]|uniref:iron uptake system protein EfeO n=1 Tax=Aeromicrobium sp. TaxID=1871063 RepID=UPI0039E42128
MRSIRPSLARTAVLAVAGTVALTGCVKNSDGDAIEVTSSADACEVASDSVESGTVTFDVENTGDEVTEFYVLADDGLRIVSEVENIAPGASRDLTVQLQPGDYFTTCKPGMVGEGVDQKAFTVTGEAVEVSESDQEAIDAAVASYTAYTKTQVAELVTNVEAFATAYKDGDDEEAKRLFPLTRINYERIEPTAESFGPLDPKIDYRKPMAEAENMDFTGFHRIEMDLWLDEAKANYPGENITALDADGRAEVADQLVADVQALYDEVHSDNFELTIDGITNGASGLLDEVATSKLPGEEDEFSHTDLYDFYANVEGAEVAYGTVRDLAEAKGEEGEALVAELDEQFATMKELLNTYGSYEDADPFVSYDSVTDEQRNELAAQLTALSEPLSRLTSVVLPK